MTLSRNEKLILNILKSHDKEMNEDELIKYSKLNRDGVRRSLYFLYKKGLISMREVKRELIEITDKGKKALKQFPDLNVLNYKSIKELPDELKPFLGSLKKYGFIRLDKGDIIVLKKENYPLFEKLKKKEFDEELKRRGYIVRSVERKLVAHVNEKGKAYEERSEGYRELNSDMIEDWDSYSFVDLNVDINNVPLANIGKLHPISKFVNKLKDIFVSMGFEEMEGNYVEDSFWNYEALFQPQDHPSRELADTFYFDSYSNEEISSLLVERVKQEHEKYWRYKWDFKIARRLVLRTHTTVLSVRTLNKRKKGKFFAIGRVFRNEAIDFKHLAEFHQIEGIVAHKGLNFRHLLGFLKTFYLRLGFKNIRFMPSYFPYTEPSVEIQVYFEPKKQWLELGGAGLFRRQVVEPLGAEYPVLAWGFGLERLLMMMLNLTDVRAFYNNDLDWLDSVGLI